MGESQKNKRAMNTKPESFFFWQACVEMNVPARVRVVLFILYKIYSDILATG